MAGIRHAWNFNIDFIGRMQLILWSSALLTVLSIGLVFVKGLNLGTDFAGGYEIQVHFPKAVSETQIRELLAPLGFAEARVQRFGDEADHEALILVGTTATMSHEAESEDSVAVATSIASALQVGLGLDATQELVKRIDFVGPQVGSQLRNQGMLAVVYSLLFILLYVAIRFDMFFAPGAIIATLHDVIVTMGVFAFLQIEFNLTVVAAILTLIGYSLNDTIVVYDRIRENLTRLRGRDLRSLVNTSINETLSRTILTSSTVLMVVVALLVLGGPFIRAFSITMFVGVLVGTYSSIAVASPLYIVFRERALKPTVPVDKKSSKKPLLAI